MDTIHDLQVRQRALLEAIESVRSIGNIGSPEGGSSEGALRVLLKMAEKTQHALQKAHANLADGEND